MKSENVINSRTSAEAKRLRGVRDGREKNLFFCEGEKVARDLLSSQLDVVRIYATTKMEKAVRVLLNETNRVHVPITLVDPTVMDFVSDMTTPPGIIVIAKRPAAPATDTSENPFILFLIGLQLPQNMGALLRTAEAAGVTRVLISEKSCDPFNPKAVRGAAGSVFRLPIEVHCSPIETLGKLKSRGIKIVAAHQDGALHYAKAEWKKPTALLVGAEGPGFNQDILQQVDATVKIPMQGKIESLNAGVAAALCMFEASRQRFAVEKS